MKPSDIFPERLKAARNLRNLEQAELGVEAKMPATSISHFESGNRKPSFDSLNRLAQALSVTTDYLLGRTENPEMSLDADPLYRHMENLTNSDRKLADEFLEMLAKRNKKPDSE